MAIPVRTCVATPGSVFAAAALSKDLRKKKRAGLKPAQVQHAGREEVRFVPKFDYFAVAFLAAAVTSAVAFFTAADASSDRSLPAASISSTVSI